MKPRNPDANQGEGDKVSARRYNRRVREFVAEGKVDEAAHQAEDYVEHEPDDAQRAERKAKRGPKHGTRVTADELIAKGLTVFDRVRPVVARAIGRLRSRLARK
jgi:hypothetical protein